MARSAYRIRRYLPSPVLPDDYGAFCEVSTRHHPRWRLTYEPDQVAPYQAHHRVIETITLASNDLEALDYALTEFTPPSYARSYLTPASIGAVI